MTEGANLFILTLLSNSTSHKLFDAAASARRDGDENTQIKCFAFGARWLMVDK